MRFFLAILFGYLYLAIDQVKAKDIFQKDTSSSGAICNSEEDCDASEKCLMKLPNHLQLHQDQVKRNVDEYGYREIPLTPWYGFPHESDSEEETLLEAKQLAATRGPATSVHLNYYQTTLTRSDFQRIKRRGWVVKNKIKVERSVAGTYFSLLQFPGAYAGIQQLESRHCQVSCGSHKASSCAACPGSHGAAWCNGDCRWDTTSSRCVSKVRVSCGGHDASSCADCPRGHGAAWCNGDCRWDTTTSRCISKSVCGLAIFSMWNDGSNNVSVRASGAGVDVSAFGGEGTGQRSKKSLKWSPGQEIEFQIEGTYNSLISGWTLKGSFVWKTNRYQMATFERPGDRNILDNFGFSSFIEDFDRGPTANGCQHKRSAEFLNPTLEYKDSSGRSRTITFTNARFTKDQNRSRPQDRYCKDWTCARSGTTRGSFYLETGGKGSVPSQSCANNMAVSARSKKRSMDSMDGVTVLDTMKFCNAIE